MNHLRIIFCVIWGSFLIDKVFSETKIIEDFEEFTRCWNVSYPGIQKAETFSDLPIEIRDHVSFLPGSKYWFVQNFFDVRFEIYPREDKNCYDLNYLTAVNITMDIFVVNCSLYTAGFNEPLSNNSIPGSFEKNPLRPLPPYEFMRGTPLYVEGKSGVATNFIIMDNLEVSWDSYSLTTEPDWEYPTEDPETCHFTKAPQNDGKSKTSTEIKIDEPFTGPHGIAPLITYTECGGVINARSDVADAIEYKYNQNYSSNELCVWTIRNTDAQYIEFYKYPTEFEVGVDFIEITTFSQDRYFETSDRVLLGGTASSEEVWVEGPVAFVVFSTNEFVHNRGFRLMVNTICKPSYGYSYTDLSSRLTTGRLTLRPYFNNMMSTFVVSPKIATTVSLEYDLATDLDNIRVFKLERSEYIDWDNRTATKMTYWFDARYFDSGVQRYSLCLNPYPSALLVIFTSDNSRVGNGTTIYW